MKPDQHSFSCHFLRLHAILQGCCIAGVLYTTFRSRGAI